MTGRSAPHHEEVGEANAKQRFATKKGQGIVNWNVIEILAFTVGVGAAINFFFSALPRHDRFQIILACASIIIFATIGVAAHLIAHPPAESNSALADSSGRI